jgi:hypothetical protein
VRSRRQSCACLTAVLRLSRLSPVGELPEAGPVGTDREDVGRPRRTEGGACRRRSSSHWGSSRAFRCSCPITTSSAATSRSASSAASWDGEQQPELLVAGRDEDRLHEQPQWSGRSRAVRHERRRQRRQAADAWSCSLRALGDEWVSSDDGQWRVALSAATASLNPRTDSSSSAIGRECSSKTPEESSTAA